jgi:glycerol-3-phosphate dehydrogenase
MYLLAKLLEISQPDWTVDSPLPGGDMENADFNKFLEDCRNRYAWLPDDLLYDYARNYGSRISTLLNGCS